MSQSDFNMGDLKIYRCGARPPFAQGSAESRHMLGVGIGTTMPRGPEFGTVSIPLTCRGVVFIITAKRGQFTPIFSLRLD